jgi:hypothetical protein
MSTTHEFVPSFTMPCPACGEGVTMKHKGATRSDISLNVREHYGGACLFCSRSVTVYVEQTGTFQHVYGDDFHARQTAESPAPILTPRPIPNEPGISGGSQLSADPVDVAERHTRAVREADPIVNLTYARDVALAYAEGRRRRRRRKASDSGLGQLISDIEKIRQKNRERE